MKTGRKLKAKSKPKKRISAKKINEQFSTINTKPDTEPKKAISFKINRKQWIVGVIIIIIGVALFFNAYDRQK